MSSGGEASLCRVQTDESQRWLCLHRPGLDLRPGRGVRTGGSCSPGPFLGEETGPQRGWGAGQGPGAAARVPSGCLVQQEEEVGSWEPEPIPSMWYQEVISQFYALILVTCL